MQHVSILSIFNKKSNRSDKEKADQIIEKTRQKHKKLIDKYRQDQKESI